MSTVQPGLRIGRLVVVTAVGKAPDNHTNWRCLCDCGKEVVRRANNLLTAKRKQANTSCGCADKSHARKHGMHGTPEYKAWQRIKQRCTQPTCKDYAHYGARGITVALKWIDDFQAFYQHIGPIPFANMQIDRIDTTGNYEPGNVRWATRQEQARNKTSTYVWYVRDKRYESSQEIASEYGVTIQTVTRWAAGFFDPRRNTFTPPRSDVRREPRYVR